MLPPQKPPKKHIWIPNMCQPFDTKEIVEEIGELAMEIEDSDSEEDDFKFQAG